MNAASLLPKMPRQFIMLRILDNDRFEPLDPADCHDATAWQSYEDAKATGQPFGFVAGISSDGAKIIPEVDLEEFATLAAKAVAAERVKTKPDDKPSPQAFPLPGTVDDANPFGEFLTIPDQQAKFAGCVYIANEHGILTPNGEILKPERFNARYGGHQFIMSADGSGPTKKAFEAFTENRAWQFPKVARAVFEPARPFADIRDDAVNIYKPHVLPTNDGRGTIDTALEFYTRFLPDDAERERHYQWMSNKLQKPWERQYALFYRSPRNQQGTGRGLHFALSRQLVGEQYTRMIKYRQIACSDGQGQFQDWRSESFLVIIAEARNIAKSLSGKMLEYEALKENVDPSNLNAEDISRKYKGSIKTRLFYSVMMATNYGDSVWLDENDRRFDVLTNGDKLTEDVCDRFAEWMKVPANVAAFVEYLRGIDLTGFNPYRAPPKSAAKAAMIEAARSDLDKAVADAIDLASGELFTPDQIITHVEAANLSSKLGLGNGWQPAARKIIAERGFPVRGQFDGKDTRLQVTVPLPGSMEKTKAKWAVYAKTNVAAALWQPVDNLTIRQVLGVL